MKVTWNRVALLSVIAVVSMLVLSCASGPRPPQPGTPAFYWGAANEMFRVGDYLKTNDNLSQITRSDNEFTVRAQPFELVVSAGLARGFNDLADNFETGARMNRANPTPFRKQVNIFRGFASNSTLQFTEAFHRFRLANKEAKTVALPFSYPTGSSTMPSQMSRVTKGIFVPDAEREDIQKDVLRRGVLLSAVRTVGRRRGRREGAGDFPEGQRGSAGAGILPGHGADFVGPLAAI